MQTELKSLSKIFSETLFRIPDYQRGYSWGEKQLRDFWSDLEQLPDGKMHYTGVLTLEPVSEEVYSEWRDDLWLIKSKKYKPVYIVDGQQRLTTAIIFLQCILDFLDDTQLINYDEKPEIRKKYIYETRDKGISRSYIFGYEKDNPSYEYLKHDVFGEFLDSGVETDETIYTKNLKQAKNFFSTKIKEISFDEIEVFFTKLTQSMTFNIFYVEKDLDVFVTFETMNNRGKQLSYLELMKNRLIYLSTKINVDDHDKYSLRKLINDAWKTIYNCLGMVSNSYMKDDVFLSSHFILYFGARFFDLKVGSGVDVRYDYDEISDFKSKIGYNNQYSEFLLDDFFSSRKLISKDERIEVSDIVDYVKGIKKFTDVYYFCCSSHDVGGRFDEKIRVSMRRLFLNQKYHIFILGVAAVYKNWIGDLKISDLEVFLTSLERYSFFCSFRSYYFSDFDGDVCAVRLVNNAVNTKEIIDFLDKKVNKFQGSSEFLDAIKNIGKDGYYGWSVLRYFMYEYDVFLQKNSKNSRNIRTLAEEFLMANKGHYGTIEHIYPQKANDFYWKSRFDKYTIPERNKLKNALGNLLPVSSAKNSSLSNKSFDIKRGDGVNDVGYRYGCMSEIKVSCFKEWDAYAILYRSLVLMDFMEKRWGFSLGGYDDKIKVMGLEFVLEKEGRLSVEDLKESYFFDV